jgi:hypothetical protein
MNIIEDLWDRLECMVCGKNPLPKNQEDLWLVLKEGWEHINQEFIDILYDNLASRVPELLNLGAG